MTTSRSQSPKSQPGKSGPDATPLEDKITCENLPQLDRKPPVSESGLADVAPVADSVKKDRVAFRSGQIFLTEQDKKARPEDGTGHQHSPRIEFPLSFHPCPLTLPRKKTSWLNR
jgi:hypothetical protein